MLGFNYENFKNALKSEEEKRYSELKKDISHVSQAIEKMLDMILNSTSNMARMQYPGVDL